jgi:hypothetical protein
MRFPRALGDAFNLIWTHFLEQGEIGQDCVNLGAIQIISSRGPFGLAILLGSQKYYLFTWGKAISARARIQHVSFNRSLPATLAWPYVTLT